MDPEEGIEEQYKVGAKRLIWLSLCYNPAQQASTCTPPPMDVCQGGQDKHMLISLADQSGFVPQLGRGACEGVAAGHAHGLLLPVRPLST